MAQNGDVVTGDPEYASRVILYIIKADQTSYINHIKPLILAAKLDRPHVISVTNTKDEWYYNIHPEHYVPALRDQNPQTKKKLVVFESTACLQYLAGRFDADGYWSGRNAWTAGLGAAAKYWLYFLKGYPTREKPDLPMKAVEKLHQNVLKQWGIMEACLKKPEQQYVALPDRPTIAGLSYFPFAMPWMFKFLGVNVKDWPNIQAWGERVLARPAVQRILEKGPTYGH